MSIMPGLMSLPLSLSEILESQGRPCKELEIWALLCQCAETLQDLVIKGEAVSANGFRYMVSPNNLLIKDNGSVTIGAAPESLYGSLYMAPEFDSYSIQNLSETAFEKMFVFSLGRTLQVASEFGLKENEVLSVSYDLDSLLQTMTKRDATVRTGLIHILEACALQTTQHPTKPSYSHTLSHVYKTVLDSGKKPYSWDSSYGSDNSDQSKTFMRPTRVRRPRPQVRHRRTGRQSFSSNSRSRSRSHSRSRSRSRDSERPSRKAQQPSRSGTAQGLPASAVLGSNSNLLNMSATSSISGHSGFFPRTRVTQIPRSTASRSVQGLLGLRQGSPAYQKYIQLKERQLRLQQARTGKSQSVLEDVRSRFMTPSMQSQELMDKTSETISMSSLMSYTLGTYMPYLHGQLGSEAALNYSRDYETDVESMFDSQKSLLETSGDKEGLFRTPMEKMEGVSDVNKTSLLTQALPPFKAEQNKKEHQKLSPKGEGNIHIKTSSEPIMTQKGYWGPEFVHQARKPAIKVAMPFQETVKNAALVRRVTVVHLTGQKFEIALDPATTGRQLFDAVISYTDLDDFYFFGLTYISDGEHFFLDGDTKLHKIAPEGWKEGSKNPNNIVSFTLFVRVKFYPESLTDFRHSGSSHLLYLQLRRDITEERIKCDDQDLINLAGLALQIEYGDYNPTAQGQNYFQAEQYVPKVAVRKLGSSYIYSTVTAKHQAWAGMRSLEGEIEFIKVKSQTDKHVWVGLSQHNLALADDNGNERTIVQAYPWNQIMKISFNKRRFSIQPKVEVAKGKPPKMNFYTNSHRKGRYLLQFSTDQHRFQIRMRTRPSNMETLAGGMSGDAPHTVDAGVGDDTIESLESHAFATAMLDPSQQPLPFDEEDDEEDEDEDEIQRPHVEHPLLYQSPPPYQPPSMAQILVDDMNEIDLDAHIADFYNNAWNHPQMNETLDMSSRTTTLDSALASERTGQEDSLQLEPSQHLSPSPISGRCIFKVMLEKEEKFGIGLTIVGGETTNSLDLGIFIKSVAPGGPAARDGRVKPGDRLIAIDGASLEGKQHHEAVALIRDAGPKVELLISQIKPPGTLRRADNPNYEADVERKLRNSMLDRSNFDNDSLLRETDRVEPDHVSHNETLTYLQFDDFLKETRIQPNYLSSDACNSDEENYPLAFTSTPPPPPLPSQPPPIAVINTDHDGTDGFQFSVIDELRVPDGDLQLEGVSSPQSFVMKRGGLDENDNENVEQALSKLRVDDELSYQLGLDWSEHAVDFSSGLNQGTLTEEEKENIQILGDIAALDVEASSSDSDFDTAVKDTLEGSRRKKQSKTSSDAINFTSFKRPTRDNLSDVIYEVILERQNGPYGIVSQSIQHPKDSEGNLYIKDLIPGSPAQLGGILASGDKLLEIQGHDVSAMSPKEADAILESAKEFCSVKVSRAAYTDALLAHKLGIKHQIKSDSGLDSYHLTDRAVSSAPGWKQEESSKEQIQSPTSLPISYLIPSLPKETTQPLETHLHIVPPPPPMALNVEDSESNTQSDVDSDVLDSSRSELEGIYKHAEQFLGDDPGDTPRVGLNDSDDITQTEKTNSDYLKRHNRKNISSLLKGDDNTKVDKINTLLPANSENPQIEDEEEKEEVSPRDLSGSGSSNSSSNSIILSPKNLNNFKDSIASPSNTINKDNFYQEKNTTNWSSSEDSQKEAVSQQDPQEGGGAGEDHGGNQRDENENVERSKPEAVVDRLPGGGYHQADGDLSQDGSHSKSDKSDEGKEDGFEDAETSRHQKQDPELVEVTLVREPGGSFGFTVAGDVSTGGCYIKHLVSAPVEQFGTLFPGDKLLMVNDKDTTNLNHVEAVTLLRNGPDEVTLKLLRYPFSMQSQEQLLMLRNLKKRDSEFAAHHVPADSESQSSIQDQIKSLETQNTIIKPYDYGETGKKAPSAKDHEATDGKHDTSYMSMGVHEREWDLLSEEILKQVPDDKFEVMRIELKKPSQPGASLGISLVDREQDSQNVIVVKRLKSDGVAQKDGRLQAGDRLLQANGVILLEAKAQDAVKILRNAQDKVVLFVSKLKETEDLNFDQEIAQYPDGSDAFEDEELDSLLQQALSSLGKEDVEALRAFQNHQGAEEESFALAEEGPQTSEQERLVEISSTDVKEEPTQNLSTTDGNETPAATNLPRVYISPRTLPANVPVIISNEWLTDLPLISMPEAEEGSAYATNILQSLVDMVERGEPGEEFKNIRQIKETEMRNAGQLPENRLKNRFRNILPYDSNRVILRNRPNRDYINASHIEIPLVNVEDPLRYIACQGPLEDTVDDFWAMLWQEEVSVIALLIQPVEGEKTKCQVYWPDRKEEPVFVVDGSLCVKLVRHYELPSFDVLNFIVEDVHTGYEREMTILQYTMWPEQGVPDTSLPILQLLQVLHLFENGKPPVIHCNAGVGRSGVVIAIDIALACIEKETKLDMYQIVRSLRCQRHGMIQTTDQYVFCYTACMEALLSDEMQEN